MIVLNLPLPPSINSYWGFHGHRRFINKEGVAFKKAVSDYISEFRTPKLGKARLEVEVVLYPKDRRIQDIDNRIKSLFDALSNNGAGVFDDDSQIDVLIVKRGEVRKGGGCLVLIDILD
jgi:crossover junction endodeoxyribonuclease RusA